MDRVLGTGCIQTERLPTLPFKNVLNFSFRKTITSFCWRFPCYHKQIVYFVLQIVVVLVTRVLSNASIKYLEVIACENITTNAKGSIRF